MLSPTRSFDLASGTLSLPHSGASPLTRHRVRLVPRTDGSGHVRAGHLRRGTANRRSGARTARTGHCRVRMTDLGATDPSDARPIGHPGLRAMADAAASDHRNAHAASKSAAALCALGVVCHGRRRC